MNEIWEAVDDPVQLLTSSAIYSVSGIIPEYKCIALTRMHLSSHYLYTVTGRWARLPREDRMCVCGDSIQSEEDVLTQCPLTLACRENCPAASGQVPVSDILNPNEEHLESVAQLCWNIFEKFK